MGYLIPFTPQTFDAMWQAWTIGAQTAMDGTVSSLRLASRVEVQLENASTEVPTDARIVCPNCKMQFNIADADKYNFWRVPTSRSLTVLNGVFFEDAEYEFLKKTLDKLKPPQPLIKAFNALWDALDLAERNWRGNEIELRGRYSNMVSQ